MTNLGLKLALGGGLLLLARSAFAGTSRSGERAEPSADGRLSFVGDLWAAISRAWPSSSDASRALVISLGAYESGWGGSTPYKAGRNAFNIIRGSADVPSIESGDHYCDAAGKCTPIKQRFRVYASIDDSVRDLLSLLQSDRYRRAYTLLSLGDVGFAAALGEAGYYTLPVSSYVASFKGVLAGVQKRLRTLALVS